MRSWGFLDKHFVLPLHTGYLIHSLPDPPISTTPFSSPSFILNIYTYSFSHNPSHVYVLSFSLSLLFRSSYVMSSPSPPFLSSLTLFCCLVFSVVCKDLVLMDEPFTSL